MRVLITNFMLCTRSGSELYVSDLASALMNRGHLPIVYAPVLGPLADDLRSRTIPVVNDVRKIMTVPDIIHGQHNHEIMTALLHFPGVPAVRVCHGWNDSRPHQFPRILRYVAVDHTVRDRMTCEWGIAEEQIDVVLNFVDLAKFPTRAPLPIRPGRAIAFSNLASHYLGTVQRACAGRGITVDGMGADIGRPSTNPGATLCQYDLVFAKARCAMEAMAVGAAVVLCDRGGLGPLVTSENFDRLRRLNFGARTLAEPVTVQGIVRELNKYDRDDAALVSRRVRSEAGLDAAVNTLIALYEDVIRSWRRERDPVTVEDELRSASAYVARSIPDDRPRAAAATLLGAVYKRINRGRFLRYMTPPASLVQRLQSLIRGT